MNVLRQSQFSLKATVILLGILFISPRGPFDAALPGHDGTWCRRVRAIDSPAGRRALPHARMGSLHLLGAVLNRACADHHRLRGQSI